MHKNSPSAPTKDIVVALTGASGMPYTLYLLAYLAKRDDIKVHCIISNAARQVLSIEETGTGPISTEILKNKSLKIYTETDIAASPASGSWKHNGMVVCPCSMSSLAAIACGAAGNLIHRAADVCLKERRKLILVTRETPLSLIHIENMARVTRAGGVIMPACPGFYHGRSDLEGMTSFMAARICDHLDINHELMTPWQGAGEKNGT